MSSSPEPTRPDDIATDLVEYLVLVVPDPHALTDVGPELIRIVAVLGGAKFSTWWWSMSVTTARPRRSRSTRCPASPASEARAVVTGFC